MLFRSSDDHRCDTGIDMNENVWVDGTFRDTVTVRDRGLLYGDGVFETIYVVKGRLILGDLHWARLKDGCCRLSISLSWTVFFQHLAPCLRYIKGKTGIMKVIVTRGNSDRSYKPGGAWRSIVQWLSEPSYNEDNKKLGIHLYPCKTRLGWQPVLAGIKHLNRLEQVLARGEWNDATYAEGLLCDYDNAVIEGTMSNVFLVMDKELVTPDLSRCGVQGVLRYWILHSKDVVYSAKVCRVTMKMLKAADEVFMCNSIFGIWPVIRYNQYTWHKGMVTEELQKRVAFI